MTKIFLTLLFVFTFSLPLSAQTLLTEKQLLFKDDTANYYIDTVNFDCAHSYDDNYIYSFNIAVELSEQAMPTFLQQNPTLVDTLKIKPPLLPSEQDKLKNFNIYFVMIFSNNLPFVRSNFLIFSFPEIDNKAKFTQRELKLPESDYPLIAEKAIDYIKQQLPQTSNNLKLFRQSAYNAVYLDLTSYSKNTVTINEDAINIDSITVLEYYTPLGSKLYDNYKKSVGNHQPYDGQLQKQTYIINKDQTKSLVLFTENIYYYSNGKSEIIARDNVWQNFFKFNKIDMMSRMPNAFDHLGTLYKIDANYLFATDNYKEDITRQINFPYLFKNQEGTI